MPKLSGSCLCGSVRYACDAEPLNTAVCHCTHCQRQTGTAFSIIVGVPAGSLRFQGEEHLGTYLDRGVSGKQVRRRFCRECGSPIVSEVEVMPSVHFLKAGTLDDRSWLKPGSHFWCDSAQPWVDIPADAQRFPGNPGA